MYSAQCIRRRRECVIIAGMIKAFSQRLLPPYSGQVQIAESDRARALTVDAETWEIHFLHSRDPETGQSSYRRVAYLSHTELLAIPAQAEQEDNKVDQRIVELAVFITGARLPFDAADNYEYWLLDPKDKQPLALIFSCTDAKEMDNYPARPEWTALPAAVLPIEPTDSELSGGESPVNYRLESLVNARAGSSPQARWYQREAGDYDRFPALLVREDWEHEAERHLCQRYLKRQSTRLLMLHNLSHDDRLRLEQCAREYIFEIERFFPLYPVIADTKMMNAMRVEAQLRRSEDDSNALHKRRDGVLYQ